MDIKFITAKYKKECKIPSNLVNFISENSKKESQNIAIFASVQFLSIIPQITKILSDNNYNVISSKPHRTTNTSQLLGCDSYPDNLKLKLDIIDTYLYIGDGNFHPNALLLAQQDSEKIKPVFTLNPIENTIKTLDASWFEKYLKKRKGNLLKFYNSDIIGVFISSKWGQNYEKTALKLQEEYTNKQIYYFIGDNFSIEETDNFPFVQCWVNTACPRIGQDDILNHKKAIVNIKDVMNN
jgi:diphthamide biosynthesis enzyme Dph1/Dph2-like protein